MSIRSTPRLPRTSTMHASAFKAQCLDVLDQVATRHVEVIVTKRGQPVAKVVPFAVRPSIAFGALRDLVLNTGDLITPEPWPVAADPLDDA